MCRRASVIDDVDPALIYARFGGHELAQSGEVAKPEDLVTYLASRPLLEAHVRRRVRALANVTLLDGHEVIEPVLDELDRVTGARVVSRETNDARLLKADVVVDATGRSGRMPAFLGDHGYERPVEQKYTVDLRYSSQFFRVSDKSLPEMIVLAGPTFETPTGAGLLAYENGTVVLTLIGIGGEKLPTDLPGVLAFAADVLPPHMHAALSASKPIGDVMAQHYPTSVWRRYDKLRRFPEGLLVIGDAVCSFNPVYGQGTTSAALQAVVLRDCLAKATVDEDLTKTYFRIGAKKLRPLWQGNRLNDFTVTPADDWRRIPKRLLNWAMTKLFAAAATDIVVTETFLRTLNLVDTPTALMHPSLLRRVIVGNLRFNPK